MIKWDQVKQLLIVVAAICQVLAVVLLFVHIPSAIVLLVIYALALFVIFVLLIMERIKEKKEDDENDYRNY